MEDVFGAVDIPPASTPDSSTFRGPTQCTTTPLIPGLYIIKGFLNEAGCEYLLSCILAEGWVSGGTNNQAMAFGKLPGWVHTISELLATSGAPVPSRDPMFSQLIANRYEGKEGIIPHVDLLRFKDHIFGITLTGSAAFEFTNASAGDGVSPIYTTLVTPGDAYILTKEARYDFKHGIPEREVDVDPVSNTPVPRTMRISLTLRGLVRDP